MNSHCFKLHRFYSISIDLSNVDEIFQGLNTKGPYLSLEKDNENSMLFSATLLSGRVKLGSGGFMPWSCNDGKEMYKKA